MLRSQRFTCLAVLLSLSIVSTNVKAAQVKLDVSLSHPLLEAKKKQTTFLKVGLTGFEIKANSKRTPVNVAIVLDKSGSMAGAKIAKAKQAALAAIQRLGKDDIVSIVAYDNHAKTILPATKLTDRKLAIDAVQAIEANGGTALYAGVQTGAEELRKFFDKQRVNRVILLSDGLANVGPKSPSDLADLGASLLEDGISVSTMGLGAGYNEDLMSQLASKSGGNHIFIERADELVSTFNKEFNTVLSVVAQEVAVEIKLENRIRPVRVLNSDAEIDGQRVVVQIPQIYSKQERYILLEVEVPPGEHGQSRDVAGVTVSYANMETKTTDRLTSKLKVNFSNSIAEVEKRQNVSVMRSTVIQIANLANIRATALRDKGDVAGAREALLTNAAYLKKYAAVYRCPELGKRYEANSIQAEKLDDANWNLNRKAMRSLQSLDTSQRAYER